MRASAAIITGRRRGTRYRAAVVPPRVLGRIAQLSCLATLWFAGALGPARAQPQLDGPADDARRAVVLIALPAVEPETQDQLREALLAQFALLRAEPRIEKDPEAVAGTSLGQRMSNAQVRGAELGAIAVFWIDPQPDGRWLLHMMDSESERILVRAVDPRGERLQAGIEAVAVLVRESTRALIEGAPVTEVAPPPAQPAPPPSPKPEPKADPGAGAGQTGDPAERPVRLSLGYHTDQFAHQVATDETPFEQGAALGVSWFGIVPFYVGANLAFTVPTEVQAPRIRFDIQRVTMGLSAGYRYRLGVAAFDFELGALLETLSGSVPEDPPAGYVFDNPAPTREVLFGVTGRVRAELFAVPSLSLFAALGFDVIFNDFEYITTETGVDPSVATVLSVMWLRPVAQLGLAFYP